MGSPIADPPIPVHCSWCDREKVVRPGGVLMCENCDRPNGKMPDRDCRDREYHGPRSGQ